MRAFVLALLITTVPAFAAAPLVNFDPVSFERRFNKADKTKTGRLSRAEATAEFPRMPEFFDEIDANKDGYITLPEVRKAMNKRVDAAMNASDPAKRYGGVGNVDAGRDVAAITAPGPTTLPAHALRRRGNRSIEDSSLKSPYRFAQPGQRTSTVLPANYRRHQSMLGTRISPVEWH